MTRSRCALLPSVVILAALAGSAAATDGRDGRISGDQKEAGKSTTSMGAGGLTGTGAVKDGARTGGGDGRARTDGTKSPSARAAGTTR